MRDVLTSAAAAEEEDDDADDDGGIFVALMINTWEFSHCDGD